MDAKLVNPFIQATVGVLSTMASIQARPGKPFLKKDKTARGDITAVIGLTGEARGSVSVSFTEQCVRVIMANMLGEDFTTLNDEVKDAIGEIGNMISGQARVGIEEMGKKLHAAIPTVIIGKNHAICHITTYPVIALPFDTNHGEFTVEVCFEE